jgi:hypothetical protein
VQRETAQSKTGIFRGYGVAEAPPGFQAGWSDCMYFSLSLSLSVFCFVCLSGVHRFNGEALFHIVLLSG